MRSVVFHVLLSMILTMLATVYIERYYPNAGFWVPVAVAFPPYCMMVYLNDSKEKK